MIDVPVVRVETSMEGDAVTREVVSMTEAEWLHFAKTGERTPMSNFDQTGQKVGMQVNAGNLPVTNGAEIQHSLMLISDAVRQMAGVGALSEDNCIDACYFLSKAITSIKKG